ncbi:shikimate dehydrogenase [Microbacterium lacus]|uniref:shikimate dehydrogenase n=1 Tax=Microbacterium lacus TaxID=415217 RepID=UPI00384E69BA
MLNEHSTSLEVWGDPIAHSKSPVIHRAAYAVLGLDWSYDGRRVDEHSFGATLNTAETSWRGLSVTYPLKAKAFAAATSRHPRAELTGAVNTLRATTVGPRGFNTDVDGLIGALRDSSIESVDRARIVGAGATASSALVALATLGARSIHVVARRPDAVLPLVELGDRLGVTVVAASFAESSFAHADVTISTLPGDVRIADAAAQSLAESGGFLLDVVYGTWPTPLASAWESAGRSAVSGLGMLLHQALVQVRIFVHGDPDVAVDDEVLVLAAMRLAVVGD